MNPIIITGVAFYMIGMLAVGYYASKRIKGSTDYIVAGRQLPLWLSIFTIFATWFGSATCLGAAGAAYQKGLLGVIPDPFGATLCLFVAGLFYIKILRRMRLLTIADFFEMRFGKWSAIVAGLCTILAYIGWSGSLLVGFGFTLHTLAGIGTGTAITVATVVVIVYTVSGGMWADVWTDFIQGTIIIVGMVILTPIVIGDLGGWNAVREALPASHFDFFPKSGWKDWLWYTEMWLAIGLGNIPGQDLMQRTLSAKDEQTAQRGAYIAGILYITVGLLPVLLGMAGRLALPEVTNPEYVLVELGLKYLHPLGMALFVGAILAAIMSSADSALLAPASIIGGNFLRYIRPSADERTVLRWCQWSVPVIGLFSLGIALYAHNIYNLMVASWTVLLSSLFIPLTVGLWWKKANACGAIASMVAGFATWLLLPMITKEIPADLAALPVGIVAIVAGSLLTQRKDPPKPLRDVAGHILR